MTIAKLDKLNVFGGEPKGICTSTTRKLRSKEGKISGLAVLFFLQGDKRKVALLSLWMAQKHSFRPLKKAKSTLINILWVLSVLHPYKIHQKTCPKQTSSKKKAKKQHQKQKNMDCTANQNKPPILLLTVIYDY